MRAERQLSLFLCSGSRLLTQDTTSWEGRRCGRAEGKKVEVVARLRIYISSSEHRPPSRRAETIVRTSELCWMTKNK